MALLKTCFVLLACLAAPATCGASGHDASKWPTADYYGALEVPSTASLSEIKASYLSLSKGFGSSESEGELEGDAKRRFVSISEAYTVLKDAGARSEYDTFKAQNYEPAQASTSIVLGTVLVIFLGIVSMLQKTNFDRERRERLESPAYAKAMAEAKRGGSVAQAAFRKEENAAFKGWGDVIAVRFPFLPFLWVMQLVSMQGAKKAKAAEAKQKRDDKAEKEELRRRQKKEAEGVRREQQQRDAEKRREKEEKARSSDGEVARRKWLDEAEAEDLAMLVKKFPNTTLAATAAKGSKLGLMKLLKVDAQAQACLDKLLGGEGDSTSSAAKSKEAEEQARIAALYETEGDCAPAELDDLELDEETLKKNADDLAQQEKDKKGKKAKQKQARAEKAAEAKGANEDTRSDKKAVKERARQKKADGEKERRKQKAAANGGKDDEE